MMQRRTPQPLAKQTGGYVPCPAIHTVERIGLMYVNSTLCRFLEVEGGDVDARVDQDLGYVMDLKQRRITFSAGGTCWALRFPTDELYKYVCGLVDSRPALTLKSVTVVTVPVTHTSLMLLHLQVLC
jgi:hypothetical protein